MTDFENIESAAYWVKLNNEIWNSIIILEKVCE